MWALLTITVEQYKPAPPVNTVAPAITGSIAKGSVLTCSHGTWTDDGSPTYSYQWQRETSTGSGTYSNIVGATSSTYTTTTSDLGFLRLQCVVTDSTPDGNTSANSNVVGPIQNHISLSNEPLVAVGDIVAEWTPLAPSNTVAPAVTGTTAVGSTLSTTNGTWANSPTSYSYQWQRDNFGTGGYTNIASATASTYTLVDADDACHIICVVTATNTVGSTPANSNSVGTITEPAPTNSVAPVVSGTPATGNAVSTTNGTWANMTGHNPTYTYQWQSAPSPFTSWSNIVGATSAAYAPVSGDITKDLRCVVTATNTGGSLAVNSNSVGPVVAGTSGSEHWQLRVSALHIGF